MTTEQAGSSISTPTPSKFTPGPWREAPFGERPYPDFPAIVCKNDINIALVANVEEQSCRANALLIAAAPDMFDALQDAEKYFEALDGPLANKVRAAIRKATGSNE